jgi:hypothetical protein
VRPDSFSTVLTTSVLVYLFCAPRHVFGGAECVRSRFQVLRSRTHFRRFSGRRDPFSCFTLPETFLVVWRALGPVFMFFAPGHIFGDFEGVGSRFHVLRPRTRLWRYRGRRVPFSCFEAPGLVFGGTYGVWSRFDILCSRTRFQQFLGRQVLFSCFASPFSFSAVPRASCPVFLFCVPGHVFGVIVVVRSPFLVLRFRNRFCRFRGRQVQFSCLAYPHLFSAVPRGGQKTRKS